MSVAEMYNFDDMNILDLIDYYMDECGMSEEEAERIANFDFGYEMEW